MPSTRCRFPTMARRPLCLQWDQLSPRAWTLAFVTRKIFSVSVWSFVYVHSLTSILAGPLSLPRPSNLLDRYGISDEFRCLAHFLRVRVQDRGQSCVLHRKLRSPVPDHRIDTRVSRLHAHSHSMLLLETPTFAAPGIPASGWVTSISGGRSCCFFSGGTGFGD